MTETTIGTPTKKMFRHTGFMTCMFLGGLILLNVAVFFSPDISLRRLLKYVFYHCNHHHWPAWYATLLWITASGTVLYTLVQFGWVQNRIRQLTSRRIPPKESSRTKPYSSYVFYGTLIVIAVVAFFVWFPPDDLMKLFVKFFYYRIYLQHGYEPFADLMESGKISWRLFVVPTLGLIIIGLLLWVRRKRGRHHE